MSPRINFPPGTTWAAHEQSHWLEFAGSPNFPDYLRVVFVAYGRHAANGHAKLDEPRELMHYLVRRDGSLPDERNIWRAIDKAIALGFLAPGSRGLCLIVPVNHVQGGAGNPDSKCGRKHNVSHKYITDRRIPPANHVTDAGVSGANYVTEGRVSPLTPSLSSYALEATA